MKITDDKRALWRRMAELAKPAHLDGDPVIALLDENTELKTRVAELETTKPWHTTISDQFTEIAKLKAAQTPRPMSEAPKDGTRILACKKQHVGWYWSLVRWDNSSQSFLEFGEDQSGNPSHWLPTPPTPEGGEMGNKS